MTGTHALKADPLFVNAESGDFRLRDNSPAADGGYVDPKNRERIAALAT